MPDKRSKDPVPEGHKPFKVLLDGITQKDPKDPNVWNGPAVGDIILLPPESAEFLMAEGYVEPAADSAKPSAPRPKVRMVMAALEEVSE